MRGGQAAPGPVQGPELAQILDAHAKWLAAGAGRTKPGAGDPGARAVLAGHALRGIDLGGADLRGADFSHADLTGADLSGAELADAEFSGAVLQDARFHEADLTNASLEGTKSLSAKSLAGSILTNAELPDDVAKFDGLDRTWEIAGRASNTFIAVLAACVFCWLTIGTTTDVRLITNSATSPLPIIGTEIPIVGFYWAAPLILLGAHFYIHLYLQRLWQGYARLPAVFPDGMSLDQKAFPWLLSSLVQFNVRRLRGRQRLSTCFDHMLCVILAWWVVPFTLALFWLRYLPRHDWVGTVWHILLIAAAAAASHLTYRLAARTLRDIAHPRPDTYVGDDRSVWGHGWRAMKRYRPNLATLGVAAGLAVVSVGAINGAPGRLGGHIPNSLVPDIFRALGFRATADFRDLDVSVKPEGWTGREVEQVQGAMLHGADLRFADGRKAFLVNANLRSANLEGADLKKANFEGSDMDESLLAGADLTKANLRNVNLEEADLEGVELELADLTGSILTRANVREADFAGARLELVRFDGTDLSTSKNLTRDQLAEACADTPPVLPAALAGLALPPCPPGQGAKHRFDR
jgi:uncharacterized protein YjbI with pentapeptide repeats